MQPALGAVAAWSRVEQLQPLTGGARNQVYLAQRGRQQLVVRRSSRPAASLDWELDLLEHLRAHAVGVPQLVPADDGRRHVDGLVVHQFIQGHPPHDSRDWRRVVELLGVIHALTDGWPQRPGFASSRQLLTSDRGGDVHLDAMPPHAVEAIRGAWEPILQGPECAIHADVGAGNILVNGDAVALLDWDEARVDVSWFDYASLPIQVQAPHPPTERG